MAKITEKKVKEIQQAADLSQYTHAELRAADDWIKNYALEKFNKVLKGFSMPRSVIVLLQGVARSHFGSVEIDDMMQELNCYPDWTGARDVKIDDKQT